ncbi:50S ribosomal protein L29 [candidate division Kazan bacterium]|uniref:Large ribosomal subunit protein uL29 n=1 Tax=candidate division Kazan bacterium TaxID=2202143 RepID=A0A420ZE15_UNCK3|nr:MAG: 50S ribosomal protein L29 [candidate division Kazan bacterium]
MAKIKNKMQDYRKQSLTSLDDELNKLRHQVQELSGQLAVGKLTSHTKIRAIRKEIARIETVKQEKNILATMSHE